MNPAGSVRERLSCPAGAFWLHIALLAFEVTNQSSITNRSLTGPFLCTRHLYDSRDVLGSGLFLGHSGPKLFPNELKLKSVHLRKSTTQRALRVYAEAIASGER